MRPTWRLRLALALTGLLLLAAVGELAARVYYRLAHGVPLLATMYLRGDTSFGWEGRQWDGGPAYPRYRIMILGDSITDGMGATDPAGMYYAVLGRRLEAYVWAYGGAGYGTLQEAMVLDRALSTVRPDLVLLQATSNDFINNTWPLERDSYYNTNLMVRPYAVGEHVVFRFPSRLGVLYPVMAHSRLAYRLVMDTTKVGAALAARGVFRSAEDEIQARGLAYGPFRESVAVTERLIGWMQARLGPVPLVVFAADDPSPYVDQWRALLKRRDVPFIEDVARAVREGEAQGTPLRFDGAHWNAAGHTLSGTVLARRLAEYLPPR
jgi:lysophospholipase L1-like esterase